ncbi:MAG: 6-bladed beta-propeller [Bacteroidales bacterium]|nr:6-bladed beta-propeller [Bacteroidales bacterium]
MKTKRISTLAFACIAFAVTMSTVSCQSKQDKKAASKQSKDSAFVFTTPKVLNVGAVIDKHFKFGTPRENGENYLIPMEYVDTTGFLSLSDVADDVEYVLLKTSNENQEVFIGQGIGNVFLCKDYIFVQMTDNIIQYDREGNLIRTIGRKGGGPGEYNWVYEMTVDDKTKKVIISTSGKINEYDFDGKFIRSQKNTYADQLMPIDSNRIAVEVENTWHDVKERLVILNRKGEVEKSFPRYQLFEHADNVVTGSAYTPHLTKFQDIICFSEAFNDTIFELKNDELQMRYYLDWGKYAMKPEYYYKKDKNKKMGKIHYSFYESDRYLIIPSSIGFDFTVVYDKKKDQIKIAFSTKFLKNSLFSKIMKSGEKGFLNDMDGGIAQAVDAISNDNKYIISYYYASDIKEYFDEAGYEADPKYPEKQEKLKTLVNSIDENKHNLFIMISKLKE